MKHLSIWMNGNYIWCLCAFACVRALIGLCIKQDNKDVGAGYGVHLLDVNFSDTYQDHSHSLWAGSKCTKRSPEE